MQVTDILSQCAVDGLIVKLPAGQLDRNDYLEVKKALELIGGKWKGGKVSGFVFKEDPSDYLSQLCQGEKINLKKEFQFFGTPDALADRLVELAEIEPEHSVLEPSAGQGSLINAIHRVYPDMFVDCYELMYLNRSFLEKLPYTNILGSDFIKEEKEIIYDRIIANPPFSKNQDIQHVAEMYSRLADGGRVVSIMSNHWRHASGKKEEAFKKFTEDLGADVYDIEEGAFRESGTNISACIVVIDKKEETTAPKIDECRSSQAGTRHIPKPSEKALAEFTDEFSKLTYSHGQSNAFIDFLDFALLAVKWWEKDRDFSHFEKKYKNLYPRFLNMIELLGIASDNNGEGFRDALGDLFMELVSHGRNGQFFTPDNLCEMMSRMTIPELKDGQNILDPACGSGRMLLAVAKRNRNANFFGCDNDVTCCKMAVINMVMNTIQGEIALMDSLKMDFIKSWEISYQNVGGMNMPVYRVIENKDDSVLWRLHMNSFGRTEKKDPATQPVEPVSIPSIAKPAKIKSQYTQLQLFEL
ncbi:MAG: N-6 DNA methylase [Mangrovibacterium sp.]